MKKQPPKTSIKLDGREVTFDPSELVPVPMVWGYARVSTEDQILDVQMRALELAGVHTVYREKISARNAHRPQFNALRKQLQPGDTVIVYSFSRLFRDLKSLLIFVDEMKGEGVALKSTSEPHIVPFRSDGRMMLQMLGAMDENEVNRVSERTTAAMAEKRRQGQYLGRPIIATPAKIKAMKRDRKSGMTANAVAHKHRVSVGLVNKHTKKPKR